MRRHLIVLGLFAAACAAAPPLAFAAPPARSGASQADEGHGDEAADLSGKTRRGRASFYSQALAGHTMADGSAMDPASNVAASRSLPLGTTARVTNLRNGRSAVVEIRDRGPYAKGRLIDLSPSTARALRMRQRGVPTVEVAPIDVPQPDGSIKHGSGWRATASPEG